jgi:hypothetical protein
MKENKRYIQYNLDCRMSFSNIEAIMKNKATENIASMV